METSSSKRSPAEERSASTSGRGEISITLASVDETAKVRIAVANPDLVAEKVVSQLAKSFPPESVMTIATNGDDDDVSSAADTATGGGEDSPSFGHQESVLTPTSRGTHRGDRSSRPGDRDSPERNKSRDAKRPNAHQATTPRRTKRQSSSPRRFDENVQHHQHGEKKAIRARNFHSSRCQTYFKPPALDYAIPIVPGQSSIKLISGKKIPIDTTKCLMVDHDTRGLPLRWWRSGATKSHYWAPAHQAGVAIKLQDYMVHPDLVYAVPITPGQTEVSVSDGGVVRVSPECIVTVFYDHFGRAAFSYDGARRKIRPGLMRVPGIAHNVKYYMLVDCQDDTKEQFVVPILDGFQNDVPDPIRNDGHTMSVDRGNITVVFYDESRQPLYTQLSDGSLIAGGLSGTPPPSASNQEEEASMDMVSSAGGDTASFFDESAYFTSNSASGGPAPRVRLRGDRMELRNFDPHIVGVGGPSSDQEKRTYGNKTPAGAEALSNSRMLSESVGMSQTSSARRQEIIERRVPVQQVKFVEKIVEVPEVHFVEKHVEVEKVEYETKVVRKKTIVERPVEHIKYVPRVETKIVERVIQVPQIIEVPRPEIIEQKVAVDNFIDKKEEVVVAQNLIPTIRDSVEPHIEIVECLRVEPEMVPVDVFVPRLVHRKLLALGKGQCTKTEVDVSLSHYNSLVLKMNPQFADNYDKLPLVKTSKGSFPLLPADSKITVPEPSDEEILKFLKATGLISS